MSKIPKDLTFKQRSPFYEFVTSFYVAICGSPAILKDNNPMHFKPEDKIGLGGVFFPELTIKPYIIYQHVLDGYITVDMFKK